MANGASFTGHITRCEPPRLLAFTWAESLGEDSEVTFELSTQADNGVLLVLTHCLSDKRDTRISVTAGWHTHLGILDDRLHGRRPQPFWSIHAAREAEYEKWL